MSRISKALALFLVAILLLGQTEWFGLGTSNEDVVGRTAALSRIQDAAGALGQGSSGALGSQCTHGCHLQNHFVGSIVQPTPNWLASASDAEPVPAHASYIPNVLGEALYRPPRFSPLA